MSEITTWYDISLKLHNNKNITFLVTKKAERIMESHAKFTNLKQDIN